MSELQNELSLIDIVMRNQPPGNWVEGEKIPWNEPEFSRRMLKEHLTQDYNAASRRTEIIEEQVTWLHEHVLNSQSSRILDLACGPGLYASRLAKLGHQCRGIDFGPASIAYAKEQSAELENVEYILHDIRTAEYGSDYDLAMFIYGEFNVFRRTDIEQILCKIHDALKPGGKLVIEPHTFEYVEMLGHKPATWCSFKTGLFSPEPHIYLQEHYWDETEKITTTRYMVIDMAGNVQRYADSMLSFTNDEYVQLLNSCGFNQVDFYGSLRGNDPAKVHEGLLAIVAQRD